MKIIGDAVYIQRGEIWSLDFTLTDEKGRPFMPFSKWSNPYLVITVANSRYEQAGDMREMHWLDLSHRYVEQEDGSIVKEPFKRFIATEPLYLPTGFSVVDAMSYYDRIVVNADTDFNIKNYLFYAENDDGVYEYKYVKSYTGSSAEEAEATAEWVDYNFRIVKQFNNTKDWIEQQYFYDIKILAGQTLKEYVAGQLGIDVGQLTDDELPAKIEEIEDKSSRILAQNVFESGAPIMPNYDTKIVILEPTPLFVGANL